MKNYRKTSHSVYDIKYHLVWITKYRKPMLSGVIATRLRELIREICNAMDIEIIKGHVSKDHVHLFVSVPPYHSVSPLIKRIKGKTSRRLLSESKMLANNVGVVICGLADTLQRHRVMLPMRLLRNT
jgi:putative transposase